MSVRQDNESNKNCPSRGLGIAAAAIGVGVGAALYYLFSKREDPDASGATSSWRCEREHALSSETSFITISEHSTTDTSMNSTINSSNNTSFNETSFNRTSDNDTSFDRTSANERSFHSMNDNETSFNRTSDNETSFNRTSDNGTSFNRTSDNDTSNSETSDNETSDTETSFTETSFNETSINETSFNETSFNRSSEDGSITDSSHLIRAESNEEPNLSFIESILHSDASFETGYMTLHLNSSLNRENTSLSQTNSVDSETNTEWDVTNSSLDVPNYQRRNERGVRRILDTVLNLASPRVRKIRTEEEQMAILREQAFRERSWSPEECSICFDMMTQTQEVMALPCTHRFHQACILPWLQERQTCPNCRKTA